MNDIVIPRRQKGLIPIAPVPASNQADESAAVFDLLASGLEEGVDGALITIVEVEGGSARSLGTQMAVLADGRYCGYVSGGCIEPVIAGEAMTAMAEDHDIVLRFGVGSPFLDVRLPCGGSIEVHIHVHPDPAMLAEARALMRRRERFAIALSPEAGTAQLVRNPPPDRLTGWHEDSFRRVYAPRTRLVLLGRGLEIEQTARIAMAAGLEVFAFGADDDTVEMATATGAMASRLVAPHVVPQLPIDPWTAVVFLFHDHDWESVLLRAVLDTHPFFIGAMGSQRTHQLRRERLLSAGVAQGAVDRIKGPVGLFGPARDATSLAFSILGDLTECRLRLDQP